MKKTCIGCHKALPISSFHTNGLLKSGEPRYRSRCKACGRTQATAWRKANPDLVRAQRRRQWYNLTEEQYQAVLAAQGGVCAICHKKSRYPLHVEHRHSDHRVRGLVCKTDNRLLGMMRDDPARLRRAADYLEAPPAFTVLPDDHQANPGAATRQSGRRRRGRRVYP